MTTVGAPRATGGHPEVRRPLPVRVRNEPLQRVTMQVEMGPISRAGSAAVLAALVLLSVPASAMPARTSVTLVPIGTFSQPSLAALAFHLGRELHVGVHVVPGFALDPAAYDPTRKQYVAEKLITELERLHPSGTVVGVTTQDMWMATKSFRYVFAIRDARTTVVSTARMDPAFFGALPDQELFTSRLDKIAIKEVAVIALGRHESGNPRSVLYGSILSLDDLDFMTEAFTPRPYSAAKRAWLAKVNAACATGSAQAATLSATPIRSTADIITVLGKGIEIEKTVLTTLGSQQPAPGDVRLVAKLRATFAQSVSNDEASLAALSTRWDDTRFKQWAAQHGAFSADLGANSLRLGSRPCGAYLG